MEFEKEFYAYVPKGGSELRVAMLLWQDAQPSASHIVLQRGFTNATDAWDWVKHQRGMMAVERLHCDTCE